MIQEGHDVGLENPLHLAPMDNLIQGAHRVMRTASWPKALGALEKVLLVDGLQHLAHGVLDHLVLERRDANWPGRTLGLGDVHTSDRLMAIPLGLQPCVQILEIVLQVLPVCLLGDPIHPHRRIGTLATVSSFEGRYIDQLCQ